MKGGTSSGPLLILRDFTLSRDLHRVYWIATLIYNGMRAFSCGLTWALIGLIVLPPDQKLEALLMPIFWPLMYPFFLIIGLALSLVRLGGIFELFRMGLALFSVSLGDPWIFFLSIAKRNLVPMADPPIFSVQLIWFVLRAEEFTIANEMNQSQP